MYQLPLIFDDIPWKVWSTIQGREKPLSIGKRLGKEHFSSRQTTGEGKDKEDYIIYLGVNFDLPVQRKGAFML
jgi:hypothetical protein